jgi:fatty aldehyde decarbonylase
MESRTETRSPTDSRNLVFIDVLSYAITGELVGMANYAAMVSLLEDPAEQMDAVRHAATELRHAEAFRRAARITGYAPIVNLEAQGWRDVRRAFRSYANQGDLTACLIIQEVMLESFAVALYHAVAEAADPELAAVFRAVGDEEEGHVDHAVRELRGALEADRDGFEAKVEKLNDEVMYHLAHMVAARDNTGPCGLCQGSCLKESIASVGLERTELRGRALNQYLRTLDDIGVRGERSLAWVARLPL